MQTSRFELLKNINKIVLSPGHGGVDPGAVNGEFYEAEQNRYMVGRIANNLRTRNIQVDVLPDSELTSSKTGNNVLQKQIDWVNRNYKTVDSCWAIQIHRDSTSKIEFTEASSRLGVYFYKDSPRSQEIADFIREVFFKEAKSKNSWARDHFVMQGTGQFGLGWLQKTIPISHLFELAFMQGDNSSDHLNRLADIASKAIYEAFTGLPYSPNTPSIPLPIPVASVNTNIGIEGNSEASRGQMLTYLNKVNPNPKINCTAEEMVDLFLEEGKLENIRGDIAFAQSLHETGNFSYGGQVLPEQNNFAGIGATNNSAIGKGAWFDLPRTGVKAQIQHLKAYSNNLPLNSELVDPRFNLVQPRGKAPKWIDLNGKWAVPGTTYGQMILQIYNNINPNMPAIPMPTPTPQPFVLDQRQIDEFMRIFNEKPEDRKIKDLPYTDEQIGYLRGIILNGKDPAMVVRIILEDMKKLRAEIEDLKKL